MTAVTLNEAQLHLPDLLGQLEPGEELTIVEAGRPVAQVKKMPALTWPCTAGSARGKIVMAADFDAPLDDFKEYME